MPEDTFKVVVVGAGIAGLFMAEKLKRAGSISRSMKAPTKSAAPGATTPIRASSSTCCRGNTNFRSSRTTTGRANMRPERRSRPTSRRSPTIAACANSSGSTKKIVEARFADDRWHLTTAKGETIVRRCLHRRDRLSAQAALSRHSRAARASPARPFIRRAGTTAFPTKGKRWGIIGGGASGIQITEALAWAGLRRHPIHPPRAMGSHPRKSVFDLVRTALAAAARSPTATPAAAVEA